MPRRLFLALLLLVAAPMVLLGWMSASAVKASQINAKESLAKLLSAQLDDANVRIVQLFQNYARQLDRELESDPNVVQNLRRMRRDLPVVRQGILVDRKGFVLFPLAEDVVGVDARAVAASLPGLVDARPLSSTGFEATDSDGSSDDEEENASPREPGRKGATLQTPDQKVRFVSADSESLAQDNAPAEGGPSDGSFAQQSTQPGSFGPTQLDTPLDTSELGIPPIGFTDVAWQQWYMAGGAQVVYWRVLSDGSSVGILLERSRWIADLIGTLPDHPPTLAVNRSRDGTLIPLDSSGDAELMDRLQRNEGTTVGSVSLVDESKRTIYRWGRREEFPLAPLVAAELPMPLASWQLRLHVDPSLIPQASTIPLVLSLGSIALLLLLIGFYVLTSVHRQISDAKNRVTFAGQVSHELRTPLTNIRLYTELAETDVSRLEQDSTAQALTSRLEVIDHESRRLQRLVSGVLEMIRPHGNRTGPRHQMTDVGLLIEGIVQQFIPSFEVAGLSIETSCELNGSISVDPDIIEMVLVNLLSNVEKYVPQKGFCRINARVDAAGQENGSLRILVEDSGPGISPINRRKVFRAFERLDDSISAPSGTGIGLTIARRAAERHGGRLDLQSQSSLGGAAFVLTIPIRHFNEADK